ncbi:DUF5687 family protein [Maribacter sp. PR1]|uniref:DUF5687 family protein n=1 Tax=Maribacter cobaltidurans TaxID=1178778 RepID=A0ABU7J022_9FLAO|nr:MULTISPECIES: DUF5687 family protein [Maribacter]MDC6390994.1 DUF5687 family protein [Maribacter sp. PR1]MEE1978386.1 DUF5687 family protein [Maribacter cobaltidurans]
MFKQFASLQWKSFFRSANFGKSLAVKILMGFFAVYMLVVLAGSGAGMYFILRKAVPDQSPMWTLSQYLIYWVLIELFLRYFMQKLPVMDIKPFLTTPVKKSSIAHYILGRSAASVYNLLSLFFFVPFCIVLWFQGYPGLNVLLWLVAIVAIVLSINYLNLLINKSDKALIAIGIVIVTSYALDYFGIFSIKDVFGPLFHALYAFPITVLVPLALAVFIYYINYKFLHDKIYLDSTLKPKKVKANTSDLAWTKRFGDLGTFLQLDLKMIWRNKRTKSQVWISLLFVFYGLIFYTQEIYASMMPMKAFLGVFMTGIFLSNFGQFIPAWDSSYYSMMMSQNIPLRKYLESKALLISVSVVFMFLLTIPYVYFGWEALAINFGCALYNLGVNIPVILYFGSFNKKRIELDQSPFGNMQGTSANQFLIMVPVLIVPILIFTLFYYLVSLQVAVIVLCVLGLVGLALRNTLLNKVTEQYRKKKYGMIAGFKEKNS